MPRQRVGRFIHTFCGIKFYPIDPDPDEIKIEDIAHALSLQCRFNGHIKQFYSVAEHCVRVANLAQGCELQGLLHDASEAYLSDIPSPFKADLPEYKRYEKVLQTMIYEKYGLPLEDDSIVKTSDYIMLVTEMRDLLPGFDISAMKMKPIMQVINPWTPSKAEEMFLETFYNLY